MAESTYMAMLKKYISQETLRQYRDRYQECVRMLNGLEKTLEKKQTLSDGGGELRNTRKARNGNKHSVQGRELQDNRCLF